MLIAADTQRPYLNFITPEDLDPVIGHIPDEDGGDVAGSGTSLP